MKLLLLLLLTGQLLSPAPAAASSSSNSTYKYQCDWCPRQSTASLFSSSNSNKKEVLSACGGYGLEEELSVPNGVYHPAAATGDLFGCGACYQLRCRDRRLCGDDGVNVVVTEKANGTGGFLLDRDAFNAMFIRNGMSSDHLAGSTLDSLQVDFRRIPCEYHQKNLAVRVEEEAGRKPGHLALRFLYQGGLTDIAAVEIAEKQVQGSDSATISTSWRSMVRRRNDKQHGVWRTARAPDGPLQLRLVVTAGSGGKWLQTTTALPADRRPGGVYDIGIQITDVAVRSCTRSCGDHNVDELR